MYRECRHILPKGRKCESPALTGQPLCYFHSRLPSQPPPRALKHPQTAVLPIPILEDNSAVQLTLSQVLAALAANRIDTRRAGLLLYGLQVAASNLKNIDTSGITNSVRNTYPQSDGTDLGTIIQRSEWDDEENEEDGKNEGEEEEEEEEDSEDEDSDQEEEEDEEADGDEDKEDYDEKEARIDAELNRKRAMLGRALPSLFLRTEINPASEFPDPCSVASNSPIPVPASCVMSA